MAAPHPRPSPPTPRLAALLTALLVAWAAPAAALEFRAGPDDPQAVLEGFEVDAEIVGRYVAVSIEATITGEALAAGELRFPLPPGAALHEAAVWVPDDERWAVAETLGRREGRRVFDETPAEARTSPLLVQQIGRDFYRAKVHAPDEADRLRLRIRYAHLVERTADGWALRFALANPDLGRGRPAALALRVTAPAGWRMVGWRGPGVAAVGEAGGSLIDPAHPLDEDIFVDLEPIEAPGPVGGLTYTPDPAPADAPDAVRDRFQPHSHLHYAPDLDDLPISPRRLVLVLDRSGSMGGAKMREARRGVARVIERLGDDDQFTIVAFDDRLEIFTDELVGVDRVPEALTFLDGIDSAGGTDIHQALSAAADIAGERADLVLITDGRPTAGQDDPAAALRDLEVAARALRIFSFGIGANLDQHYLTTLASGSGGDVAFALDDGEIAGDLFALVDRAVAGGVRDATLAVGQTDRDLGRVLPGDELLLGLIGALPETLRLTGEADGGPVERVQPVPALPTGDGPLHRAAAPLMAKARADRLERTIDLEGETDERVAEAVRLARTYGIITRYSSHLALIDEADYAERGIDRIARDPAGIALGVVDGPVDDEGRIGGAGTGGGGDADGDGIADDWDNDAAPAPPEPEPDVEDEEDNAPPGEWAPGPGADAGAPGGDTGTGEDDPLVVVGPDGDGEVLGCVAHPGHGRGLPLLGGLLIGLALLGRRRRN